MTNLLFDRNLFHPQVNWHTHLRTTRHCRPRSPVCESQRPPRNVRQPHASSWAPTGPRNRDWLHFGYTCDAKRPLPRCSQRKRKPRNSRRGCLLEKAEGMGFEPTIPFGTPDFETRRARQNPGKIEVSGSMDYTGWHTFHPFPDQFTDCRFLDKLPLRNATTVRLCRGAPSHAGSE